jgi:hypothetical protein
MGNTWRTAAGIGVTVAGLLAAAVTPAKAATDLNEWRVANVWGSATGTFDSIAAVNAVDAWAVGSSDNRPFAAHWNGHAWQTVVVPDSSGWTFNQVIAQSANDVWIYAGHGIDQQVAFIFNGSHWSSLQLPGTTANQGTLSVLAANDAWYTDTAGSTGDCLTSTVECSDVYHWNGSTWTDLTLPAEITGLAALNAKEIWAVGTAGSSDTLTAYEWTDSSWRKASLPAETGVGGATVALDKPTDLWLSFYKGSKGYALHWTGSKFGLADDFDTDFGVEGAALDGQGGVWLNFLDHLTSTDKTVIYPLVVQGVTNHPSWMLGMGAVAPIPGTDSDWSAGTESTGNLSIGHPIVALLGKTPS